MNKTRISWVRNPDRTQGYTWNVVTGCLHGCDYCYARKITMGFPMFKKDFKPRFHPERLNDPIKIKKPSTIFVCSMADMFGDWVKWEWIEQILDVARTCPQHTFLFLTKNGLRMSQEGDIRGTNNAWYGQTCTGIADRTIWDFPIDRFFLSFEPLLGDYIPNISWIHLRWLIIGSLNQNGKPVSPDKGGTRKEWVLPLLDEADKCKIPVFIKRELYELYPDLPQRQELPYLKPLPPAGRLVRQGMQFGQ